MNVSRFIWLLGCLLAACAASPDLKAPTHSMRASEKAAIGQKIWQNECGGRVDGLTAWNVGEEFPSLGIGHFIWYPAGVQGRFEESWPSFIAYAIEQGANPPAIARRRPCPWPSREAFLGSFEGPELRGVRAWLAANVALQTDFIIARYRAAVPAVIAAAPASERERISANHRKLMASPQGVYAAIDYVNFKGEGIRQSERYQGRGWGLLQVLGEMKDVPAGAPAAAEFAAAAKRVLSRRIANSPPARGESRWESGWHRRCDTYAAPL
ncbi:MAG: hypothetical protein ACO3RK_06000 [Luteolibacter sp.]